MLINFLKIVSTSSNYAQYSLLRDLFAEMNNLKKKKKKKKNPSTALPTKRHVRLEKNKISLCIRAGRIK